MINNRQAGRRRGRGGQQQRSQGGNPGRGQDNGNRIDSRARGNAAQLHEKYKTLARDSQMAGDRVTTEYYLQFADHYFRVLAETRSRFEENRRQNGGAAYEEDEQDYDDDGEPIVRPEPRQQQSDTRQNGQGQQGQGGQGNFHQARSDQQGHYDDDRPRRSNGNAPANGNSYDNGQDRYARDERNGEQGGNVTARASEPDQDQNRAPVRAEAMAPPADFASEAEQPRRRGRPRRAASVSSPGAVQDAAQQEPAPVFEADRLPPSLSISAVSDESDEKPRRRRGRPPATETTPVG